MKVLIILYNHKDNIIYTGVWKLEALNYKRKITSIRMEDFGCKSAHFNDRFLITLYDANMNNEITHSKYKLTCTIVYKNTVRWNETKWTSSPSYVM